MTRKRLSESDGVTLVDLSGEKQLTNKAPSDDPVDIVDEAIWGMMDEVIAFGYSESAAETKVRDAIEKLVKDEVITEVPEYDETDGVKSGWIANSLPRVKNYLSMKGDIL